MITPKIILIFSPKDACSSKLPPIVNWTFVKIYPAVVVQPHLHRKSAPFRVRANLEPLSPPLQQSIRFFQHLLPAPLPSPLQRSSSTRRTCGDWYWLTTFHMFYKQICLGRLCIPSRTTGMLAHRQYSPTCLPMPFWLWGRMVTLAPLVLRYVIPRLHSHYPCRSFPE